MRFLAVMVVSTCEKVIFTAKIGDKKNFVDMGNMGEWMHWHLFLRFTIKTRR